MCKATDHILENAICRRKMKDKLWIFLAYINYTVAHVTSTDVNQSISEITARASGKINISLVAQFFKL